MVRYTIKKVRHSISKYNMVRQGDGVVVAVSGGPDSVCLLDILHELRDELGIQLVVAHFDHGLRSEEDDDETRFVESMARSLDLRFETKKAGGRVSEGAASLEEWARNARYEFFEEVKERTSAQKIALGHNLNDQAETVLMRLLRGSGPTGLSGIPPLRDEKIIRPLIELSRGEIESYLGQKGLSFVTDSSNLETRHARNRIRLELLPLLRDYQPQIVELLGQTAEIMRADEKYLEERAEEWVKEVAITRANGQVRIPLSLLTKLPEALRNRVIRCVLKTTGGSLRRVSMRHIEAINSVAAGKKPQALVNLPHRVIARRVYDTLVFTAPEETGYDDFCYFLDCPAMFHLDALGSTVSLKELENAALPDMGKSPWTAFLNADRITYPLMIRNFRPGDRFVPFGMSGHKKLKDFFMDLKISSEARARIPILLQRNMPIWVCGLRIDDRFKVTPDAKKVLRVTFKRWVEV
jgi:tRNA(Ile)-lysidine synthase